MVAAKSDTAHWRLGKQFEKRQTEKRYLAVVHGRMEPHADVIDLPLGSHPTAKAKYSVRWDATGRPSVTIYRVREVYDGFTLVELELKTGRTHQIRVHLSHMGYPIVGDDLYGGKFIKVSDVAGFSQSAESPARARHGLSARDAIISRSALHAALLGIRHPMNDQPMVFQAPLPADMRRLIELLRHHRFIESPNVAGATIDLEKLVSS
jgi:23S rRNA pseudouridine1911/1915/1917 synthase